MSLLLRPARLTIKINGGSSESERDSTDMPTTLEYTGYNESVMTPTETLELQWSNRVNACKKTPAFEYAPLSKASARQL